MPVLPKFTYKFNAVPITIPENCFVDIDKLILKFIWRSKRFRLTNTILKEKNKMRELKLPNFNTYYNATVINAMRETWVQSLGWEDPLEKRKATHSSILA